MGVKVLRFQVEVVNSVAVLSATAFGDGAAKVPDTKLTFGEVQDETEVAVTTEELLKLTPPVKLMSPEIGTARAHCAKTKAAAKHPANLVAVFIMF